MKNLKYLRWHITRGLDLIIFPRLKSLEDQNSSLVEKLLAAKKDRAILQYNLNRLTSKIYRKYPQNRDGLKSLSGKTVELDGIYVMEDDRGVLVKYVDYNKKMMCDHLWIRGCSINASKGDVVIISGTVEKYGSMSYQKKLTENYGLTNVSIRVCTNNIVRSTND